MALDKAALKAALKGILDGSADNDHDGHPDGTPVSAADAGQKLAHAYAQYAAGGLFGSSTPTFTGQEGALATALGVSLILPGVAATHAAAWGTGLATFWISVPVAGAQAGATVPPTGAAALTVALTALFSVT